MFDSRQGRHYKRKMKKIWIKILFAAIILLAFIFTAAHLFLVFQGRSLVIKQLETLTKKKVTMGDFAITAPLNLQIKNLNIEGLAKADNVIISPSILSFITGNIGFNDIRVIKPEFIYEKTASPAAGLRSSEDSSAVSAPASSPVSDMPSEAVTLAVKAQKKKGLPRLVLKHLDIRGGKINFTDHTVGPEGIRITVKDINFKLTNLYLLPRSVIANFELKGKIPWKEGEEEGSVEAGGWFNLFKKDMQAEIKIRDIDGVYLYPYYSSWVDLEKARIEKAKLNFSSNIQGLNNNVTAECHLELGDIVRRPLEPQESDEKAARIADAVLDIFRSMNQGKIVLDFTIRTKMTRPEFGFNSIKMAFEDKLAKARKASGFKAQDVLGLPAHLVQNTFKTLADLTTAVIGGTIDAGKQIVKSVEDSLKEEEKKEE